MQIIHFHTTYTAFVITCHNLCNIFSSETRFMNAIQMKVPNRIERSVVCHIVIHTHFKILQTKLTHSARILHLITKKLVLNATTHFEL